MDHKIQSVICIDCETGGLVPSKNAITQIAMISFSLADAKEIGRYESFIQPYAELQYDDEALKYTGITYQMIMSGKEAKQVVSELCEQFKLANTAQTHTKKPILLGHNIQFDIAFITYLFNHCKVDISKFIDCKIDAYGKQYPAYFDTMWLSRMKFGADHLMTKYNLASCCEKEGVSLTDAHSAMNDVVSTKDLFISYMNSMRSGSSISSNPGQDNGVIEKERPRKHFQF